MKAITHAQQRVIEVIHRRLEAGAAPTLRELADELRMSRTGAREHLHALARKGIVRLRPGAHRGIELTGCRAVPLLVTDAEAARAAEALDAAGLPHLAARLRGGA